jgi:hypothetical protein
MPKIKLTEQLKSILVIVAAIVVIVIIKWLLPTIGVVTGFGLKP